MHKPRLSRLARIHLKHPLYFVTLCTFERKLLLAQPTAHAAFTLFCQNGAAYGAFVGRYVLMPDHLHLFVTFTQEGVSLSDWVKSLKNTLSKSWRAGGIAAPHWQKGFFDHLMRSEDSYAQKWDYVAANPIRAGLVTSPEAWPYQGMIHDLRFR
jgi:REP element-mobilizing transposase RayT